MEPWGHYEDDEWEEEAAAEDALEARRRAEEAEEAWRRAWHEDDEEAAQRQYLTGDPVPDLTGCHHLDIYLQNPGGGNLLELQFPDTLQQLGFSGPYTLDPDVILQLLPNLPRGLTHLQCGMQCPVVDQEGRLLLRGLPPRLKILEVEFPANHQCLLQTDWRDAAFPESLQDVELTWDPPGRFNLEIVPGTTVKSLFEALGARCPELQALRLRRVAPPPEFPRSMQANLKSLYLRDVSQVSPQIHSLSGLEKLHILSTWRLYGFHAIPPRTAEELLCCLPPHLQDLTLEACEICNNGAELRTLERRWEELPVGLTHLSMYPGSLCAMTCIDRCQERREGTERSLRTVVGQHIGGDSSTTTDAVQRALAFLGIPPPPSSPSSPPPSS